MSCPVTPDLDSVSLLRVIPVGQHQQVQDVAITVYSLEVYERGFVAVVRIDWAGPSPGPFPSPRFRATDERGNTYTSFGGGGSGGGKHPDNTSWRTWEIFSPGIAADATFLTLTVSEFHQIAYTPNPDRTAGPTRTVERIVTGPWQFQVAVG